MARMQLEHICNSLIPGTIEVRYDCCRVYIVSCDQNVVRCVHKSIYRILI